MIAAAMIAAAMITVAAITVVMTENQELQEKKNKLNSL